MTISADLKHVQDIMNRNPEPTTPCNACGARDWWYRLPGVTFGTIPNHGAWVCGRCHPMPGTVPAGDVIIPGNGKMSAHTEHPDGSTSCRWFPETDYSPTSDRHETKLENKINTDDKSAKPETTKTPALETPAKPPRTKPVPVVVEAGGGEHKGRPKLNIKRELICDTLKREKNIKAAAVKLGCSRGYIYKMVPAAKVKELVKA